MTIASNRHFETLSREDSIDFAHYKLRFLSVARKEGSSTLGRRFPQV
jgi:hypothetical protein